MSAWQTIKSLVTFSSPMPNGHAVKQAGSVEVFGPFGQRNADWTLVADMPRIQDAARKCSIAFACMTLLADAVAESPLRVYQTVDGEPEEALKSPAARRLRDLLANPNPYMSEAEFMVLTVMTMALFNYAVTEKVRSEAKLPVQLWPLRPDWLVRERTGQESTRIVYRVPNQDPRVIDEEDIIVTPYYHDPMRLRLGWGPLSVIAREIGVDVSLTDLLKVFIDSGGIPPWAVEIPETNPDQTKLDTFRLMWQQKYGGSRAYGNIGILYGGMKLVKVGDSIGDMAWPDLRGLTEAKIAQAFRVPLDLVQGRETLSSGSLTTTEMTGAMAFLQNHGAQPLRMRIDGAFSRALLADYGLDATYSLEFDTSGILALQEDEDAKHTRWRANFDAGLVTMNEARQMLGLPDLGTDGEVIKTAFTTILQPITGLSTPEPPERASASIVARSGGIPAIMAGVNGKDGRPVIPWWHENWGNERITIPKSTRTYRDIKALSPVELEKRASVLTTTRRERETLIQIGARQMKKFFKAQAQRIVAGLPKSGPVPDIKAVAIDWDEEDELLREILGRFHNAVGDKAYGTIADVTGASISWDLANPNIARILERLGQNIVDINDKTRADIIERIARGQQEGLSLSGIADSIRDLFDITYANRHQVVARSETQASYNLASQLGYQESGVVEEAEMIDNPDHDTDPGSDGLTCADRHGMVVNIGDMDRHVDAEHPNGSLAFIPILSTPLGQ
jgi:HK97 family phage portal protein